MVRGAAAGAGSGSRGWSPAGRCARRDPAAAGAEEGGRGSRRRAAPDVTMDLLGRDNGQRGFYGGGRCLGA